MNYDGKASSQTIQMDGNGLLDFQVDKKWTTRKIEDEPGTKKRKSNEAFQWQVIRNSQKLHYEQLYRMKPSP